MNNIFSCPNCGEEIELSKALSHQINEQIKSESESKLKEKLSRELELKIKDKENELQELKDQNKHLMDQLLELNKSIRGLKDKDDKRELELQKELAKVGEEAKLEALRQSSEEHRLKDMEKEKKITDLVKEMEILKQKAQQGSQQTQGEALELDIQKELETNFPQDEIAEVKKGVRGADIIQTVKTPMGFRAGAIVWEIKKTKNWEQKWIDKIKEDQRLSKAELAVIITQTMPKDATKGIFNISKIWVCDYQRFIVLATLLRNQLLEVAKQKAIMSKSDDISTELYEYITSHDFSHQLEAIIETYLGLQEQITKERMAFEKQWSQREVQLNKMYKSLFNIYGGIAEIAGQGMPQIKGIDLDRLGSGDSADKISL